MLARVASGVVLSLFACLLLWGTNQAKVTPVERALAINRALTAGTLNSLSTVESESLAHTLNWLAASAGVSDRIVLNEPLLPERKGTLHVYVSNEKHASITRCGANNAIYDAELDAVFLNEELIKASRWLVPFRDMGEIGSLEGADLEDELLFIRVYLRFVILHELAHRQLHRMSGGAFDAGGEPAATASEEQANGRQRLELEADQFAWRAMDLAYGRAAAHGIAINDGEFNSLSISRTRELSPSERAQLAFVDSVLAMTAARRLGFVHQRVLQTDDSHPSFVSRAMRLLKVLRSRSDLRAEVGANAEAVQAMVQSFADVQSNATIDIESPSPLYAAAFGTDEIILVPTSDDRRYRVSYRRIARAHGGPWSQWLERLARTGGGSPPTLTVDAEGTRWKPIAAQDDRFCLRPLTSSAILRAEEDGGIWRAGGFGGWTKVRTAKASPIFGRWFRQPAGPESEMLLADSSFVELHTSDRVVASRPLVEIAADVRSRMNNPDISVDDDSFFAGQDLVGAALLVKSKDTGSWRLFGVAEFRKTDLGLEKAAAFIFPSNFYRSDDVFVAIPTGGKPRYLLVQKEQKEGIDSGWTAWELFQEKAPSKVASGSFLITRLSLQARAESSVQSLLSTSLSGIWAVPPNHFLINWTNEAVVLVDLRNGHVNPVFYPGIEGLRVSMGHNGMALIWMESTYRATLIDVNRIH